MRVLAVIPARGGSKRLPRKNERDFRGKPLLAWTILAAHNSRLIDRFFVSTEDWALGLLAHSYACRVIKRPDELATDTASSEDVLRHALSLYPAQYVVLLQPTSPLRDGADIDGAIGYCWRSQKPVVSYSATGTKHGGKNGAIYVASSDWIQTHSFADEHLPYVMPDERSLDIDTMEDLCSS